MTGSSGRLMPIPRRELVVQDAVGLNVVGNDHPAAQRCREHGRDLAETRALTT